MSTALNDCIWHLEECITTLQNTVDTLQSQSKETTHLCNVILQCNKQHSLATEFDMERATKDLNEEVEPLLKPLGDKLQKHVLQLQRNLDNLSQQKLDNGQTLQDIQDKQQTLLKGKSSNSTLDVMMGPATKEQMSQLKDLNAAIEQKRQELRSLQ